MTYFAQRGTSGIEDDAITAAKIAAGAVDSSELAAGAVTNAAIAAGAAIELSKLATDPLARANHTGTQLASTVSDFDTQVRLSRLDQMAAPTAAVAMGSQKITGVADGTAANDAVNKSQLDAINPEVSSCLVKSANYTMAAADDMVIVDTASVTITLPASPTDGKVYKVKARGVSSTLASNGKNIDGSSSNKTIGNDNVWAVRYCAALGAGEYVIE